MHLVTTEHMRRLEEAAVEAGSTWANLMEQAGWGVAQEALRILGNTRGRRVLVLVGPGNNGGDGLVVARHLHDADAHVTLYIWHRSGVEQDANWQRCRQRTISETMAEQDPERRTLRDLLTGSDLVVDALLGMGVSRPVTGELATIVDTINHSRLPATGGQHNTDTRHRAFTLLSVDVPTGIHSDTGAVMGTAIWADATVATGLIKQGLLLSHGTTCAGTVTVADIGIPTVNLEALMSRTLDREYVQNILPSRPADSHKGTFGKVLVVAGSLFYPGAAALATAGAGRAGAGLVTLATARSIIGMSGRGPDVTLLPLPEADIGTLGRKSAEELCAHLEGYQALLIGPGLGREDATGHFLKHMLGLDAVEPEPHVGFRVSDDEREQRRKAGGRTSPVGFRTGSGDAATPAEAETSAQPTPASDKPAQATLPPTVLDADGLNLLSEIENWAEHVPPQRFILTPHPGEMKRLLHTDDLDDDYVQVATNAAKTWQQVVVLKGATTIVAAPDGRSMVHADCNPALATAGTGDVLSGVIAGLLAQSLELFDAAVLGVYLHAAAGALLRDELGDMGTLASDLLPRLPKAIKKLREV
jgi:NAD(P)H-hydrate epimerase